MQPAEQRRCTHASPSCTNTAWPHENKPRQSKETARARGKCLGRASFGNCQRRHNCESSSSCAHIMRPAGQRRCNHASLSCTNTARPHENKPRQSKLLVHAANVSVVLNSAIASAATPANPAAAAHTSCAPLSSAAAPTHHHRAQTPQRRTKTSRGRANSSCTRQMPRSCLIRQLPAPSHLRIQRQLCTHHAPR